MNKFENREVEEKFINYPLETLSSHISETEIKVATWFTEKRFFEVCEAIEKEIGNILSSK